MDATKFLENYTGKDSMVALRIKVKDKKSNVTVEFTDTETAERMFSRINGRDLNYEECELRAWDVDKDFLATKKEFVLSVEADTLYFGCQTSSDGFVIIEEVANVKVNFLLDRREVEMVFTYLGVEYKMKLSNDSISQIHERRPWNNNSKFIVIQSGDVQLEVVLAKDPPLSNLSR